MGVRVSNQQVNAVSVCRLFRLRYFRANHCDHRRRVHVAPLSRIPYVIHTPSYCVSMKRANDSSVDEAPDVVPTMHHDCGHQQSVAILVVHVGRDAITQVCGHADTARRRRIRGWLARRAGRCVSGHRPASHGRVAAGKGKKEGHASRRDDGARARLLSPLCAGCGRRSRPRLHGVAGPRWPAARSSGLGGTDGFGARRGPPPAARVRSCGVVPQWPLRAPHAATRPDLIAGTRTGRSMVGTSAACADPWGRGATSPTPARPNVGRVPPALPGRLSPLVRRTPLCQRRPRGRGPPIDTVVSA